MYINYKAHEQNKESKEMWKNKARNEQLKLHAIKSRTYYSNDVELNENENEAEEMMEKRNGTEPKGTEGNRNERKMTQNLSMEIWYTKEV